MNLGPEFKDEKTWFADKKKTQVNFDTIRKFQRGLFDRVKDTCLNLPPITDHYRDFDACIDTAHAEQYNVALLRARKLRMSLEKKGKATQQDLQKLMAYLQTLQQFMVSPLLALKGAKEVQSDPELVQKCSFDNTLDRFVLLNHLFYTATGRGIQPCHGGSLPHISDGCC
jgi:hypothetical protein